MATKASALLRRSSALLRAARKASLRSRSAAAAASRAARAAGVAADVVRDARLSLELGRHPWSFSTSRFPTIADYKHLPDDCTTPTDKDLESDEAVWALYERWCKALNKKRNHAEMVRRFKIFRYNAEVAHRWNTNVPADPEEAAIWLQKRREAKLLFAKGEDVSHFDDCHQQAMLGPLADGGDPYLREFDYNVLKVMEKREARRAPKDVTDSHGLEKKEARRAPKDVTVE